MSKLVEHPRGISHSRGVVDGTNQANQFSGQPQQPTISETNPLPRRTFRKTVVVAASLLACSAGLLLAPQAASAAPIKPDPAAGAAAPTRAIVDGHVRPLSALKTRNLHIVVDQVSLDHGLVHAFTSKRAAGAYKAGVSSTTSVPRLSRVSGSSFFLYSLADFRGSSIYFSGAWTSRNLTDFPMCFLCGSWNDQASSYSTNADWVDLSEHTQRLGRTLSLAPGTHGNLFWFGFDNIASSYLIR